MKIQVAVLTLAVGLATVSYQGCSGIHENAGQDLSSLASEFSASEQAGFLAFATGFYQFTQTQNCAMCHGKFQSPKFAQPDLIAAYNAFKPLVNAQDPASSVINVNAGNGHCSAAPCSDPSVRPEVLSLLESWASAELSGGGGTGMPKFMTASMPVPATLPVLGAAPKVVRFPLAGFNIPALSRAILEIEMNAYSPGEYKVARLKVGGATATVTVAGIHVYVKSNLVTAGVGIEDPNQGMAWTTVISTMGATTLPTTLPTGPLSVPVLVTNSLGIAAKSYDSTTDTYADMITVGFDDVELGGTAVLPGDPGGGTTGTTVHFSDLISNNPSLGIFAQSCIPCHSGASPAGALNLTVYSQALNAISQIQSRTNNSANPMPPSGLLPPAQRAVITNWVNGGGLQ